MKLRHPPALIEVRYAEYAQEYMRKLALEHFMESTPQATQRKITLAAFDQVHLARPEVQAFNELLVQYPLPGQKRPGQVVPDNMVVICEDEIKAEGSYDMPLQPVGPFMTLEYVSKRNWRKDYDDNFDKYEKHLLVPYYLMYVPDIQELTLYRLKGKKYVSVPPNKAGRHPVAQLELEVAILEGWVRYWFRGELLALTGELKKELDQQRQRAEREERRADDEKRRADDEKRRADDAVQQAEEERQARLALEQEVEQLRAQLKKNGRR